MSIPVYYAGNSATLTNSDRLPSPSDVKTSFEEIWDSEAGRNDNGTMIATYKASKTTHDITWGLLTSDEMQTVRDKLSTGFFYFGVGGKSGSTYSPPSSASLFYRSEISRETLVVGQTRYYKNVSVQVIEK